MWVFSGMKKEGGFTRPVQTDRHTGWLDSHFERKKNVEMLRKKRLKGFLYLPSGKDNGLKKKDFLSTTLIILIRDTLEGHMDLLITLKKKNKIRTMAKRH